MRVIEVLRGLHPSRRPTTMRTRELVSKGIDLPEGVTLRAAQSGPLRGGGTMKENNNCEGDLLLGTVV